MSINEQKYGKKTQNIYNIKIIFYLFSLLKF